MMIKETRCAYMENLSIMGMTTDLGNRMMNGIKFLRIEERVIHMYFTNVLFNCRVTSQVVFYVNLANWSTALGGSICREYNMKGTSRVEHGNPKNVKHEWKDYPFHLIHSGLSDS